MQEGIKPKACPKGTPQTNKNKVLKINDVNNYFVLLISPRFSPQISKKYLISNPNTF
jgi:hypothetical protein